MKAIYSQKGETLDYTATEAVEYGAVVDLATRVGVAAADIPANGQGHVHVVGVFEMDKKTDEKITVGAAVYYDKAEDKITGKSAEGVIPAGYAVAEADTTATTVLVNIACPPAAPAAAGASGDIESKLAEYQKKITVSGILKGTGDGTVEAAVSGVDYAAAGG